MTSGPPRQDSIESLLAGHQVVICLGPGGVGKTTTSAAFAVAAAMAGRRVVVLTIDPARRLADAMGLGAGLDNEPQLVDGPWSQAKSGSNAQSGGGQLWAAMLDANAAFASVIEQHAATAEQAASITNNRLFKNLTSSLSGTQEYMATERLRDLYLDDRFDLVIVDTPPSRHALDFLDSPARLVRFIDHPLYRSVLAPRRGLMKMVNVAAQLVIRTIGRVVGAELLTDVVDFFAAFDGLDEGFRARADEVDRLLASEHTAYVLVSAPRPGSTTGTRWIASELTTRSLHISALIANRLTPQAFAGTHRLDEARPLDQNLAELGQLARHEGEVISQLVDDLGTPMTVRIDDQMVPISSLSALTDLAAQLVAADQP
ncbi:MAG: anion-transporting ArsA/GET3 family ATPase [Acidimicrobiales bacterium]|jgi:anion-transporting  ArsA/GET3 family ATPase